MAISRYLKKPSIPSLNGTPEAALPVLKPIKETLEILTGRKGEKIAQLAGTVSIDDLAERMNEIIRVLQDGSDTEVAVGLATPGISVPPAPAAPLVGAGNLSDEVLALLGVMPWSHDLIINGDFRVAQRPGAGAAVTVNTASTFGVQYAAMDRWYCRATHPHVYTAQQIPVATPTTSGRVPASADGQYNQFSYALRRSSSAGSITSSHSVSIGTTIDALHYGPYREKAIELSFWVRSHLAGTYTICAHSTLSDTLLSDGRECCVPYTINAADTWEFKTVTIPAPPSAVTNVDWRPTNPSHDGISLLWVLKPIATVSPNQWTTTGVKTTGLGVGATGQVDWTATGTPTFDLACVHTSPIRRSPTDELMLCRKFYQRSGVDTLGSQIGAAVFGGSNSGAVGKVHPYIQFSPPMKTFNGAGVVTYGKFTTYASTGVAGTCRRLTDNTVMNTGQTGVAMVGDAGHNFEVDLAGFVDQRIQFGWVAEADFWT